MTIAQEYAQYCHELSFDELPAEVTSHVKKLVLDHFGVSIGAVTRVESGKSIVEGIRSLADSRGGTTVFATGEQLPPQYAALINGSLAHSIDYDDTHRPASLHPGASVIPAAVAVAERENIGGEKFITGVVAGYEVACRLGMAINPPAHYEQGFHPTGTCGVFGANAAVATMLDFDVDRSCSLFGINGSQASGSIQCHEEGDWNNHLHPGFAAHAAILASSLAANEFRGSFAPIEGDRGLFHGYTSDPEPDVATAGLGTEYEIRNAGIKNHPCCGYMNLPFDLLLDIVGSHTISPESVKNVVIELPTPGVEIVGRPPAVKAQPQTLWDAQHSQPYGVALAITQRDVNCDTFISMIAEGYGAEFQRVMDITTVRPSEDIDSKHPQKWAARVIIETDTDTYRRYGEHAKGEPENPMTWEEVVYKYEELVDEQLDNDALRSVIENIQNLENISIHELLKPITSLPEPTPEDRTLTDS